MKPTSLETPAAADSALVSLGDIRAAAARIRGVAMRTPLLRTTLVAGLDLYLKPEMLQPVGSFKLRGAYNKIASLSPEQRAAGVITYSSGNHAQAVAFAARALGTKAVIVMPSNAPQVKLDSTRRHGGEVVLVGPASSERLAKAEALSREHGYVMVPPYDDPLVISGQGTMGLEIMEDLADADVILSPVSGGGIISGIAAAVKQIDPRVKVIGVEPELAADAQHSKRSGHLQVWPAEKTTRTIADGLRTQSLGELPWKHVQAFVDDIITVTDDEILTGVRELALGARLIAEPSGAVTYAASRFHTGELGGAKKVVAVLSGGNIDPAILARAIAQ